MQSRPYAREVSHSQDSMFVRSCVPGSYVPKILCSLGLTFLDPMFPWSYVLDVLRSRILCSHDPMFVRSYVPGSYVPKVLFFKFLCCQGPMILRSYVPRFFVPKILCSKILCSQDPASDMQSVGFCVSLSCHFELSLLCISSVFQCSSLKECCLCCCSSAWGICVCSFTLTASSQSCFVLQLAPQVPTSWQIIPSSVCGAAWRLSWWLIMNVGTGDSQQCREEGKKKGKNLPPLCSLEGEVQFSWQRASGVSRGE